jgi:uncharacterized protein (DUF305 family)
VSESLTEMLRHPRGGVTDAGYKLMLAAADKIDELCDAIIRADQYEMSKKARDILHEALEGM